MGHSDKPDGASGPPGAQKTPDGGATDPLAPVSVPRPPPLPEVPTFAPSLDLLEGLDGDTVQTLPAPEPRDAPAEVPEHAGDDPTPLPWTPSSSSPARAPDKPQSAGAQLASAGARPLDPNAFDPEAPPPASSESEGIDFSTPSDMSNLDLTLRIDLARPVGLPRIESRARAPLPVTKPARPLGPKPETDEYTPRPGSEPALVRTPISSPVLEPPSEATFDIDVEEGGDSDFDGAFKGAFSPEPTPSGSAEPASPSANSERFNFRSTDAAIIGLPLPAPLPVGVSTRDIQTVPTVAAAPPPPPRPAPPRVPTSAIDVRLPCSVLVVDEDLRAGAQIAARLMEVGYTCRVTDLPGVPAVLAQQTFDVALIDVPSDEMARDQGLARAAQMAPWTGPIVLTADIVLPADDRPMPPQVRAVISKPLVPGELIRTLESARFDLDEVDHDEDYGLTVVTEEVDPAPVDGGDPSAAVHEIPGGVRVLLTRADGRVVRGVAHRAAYGGQLELDVRDAPALDATVDVEVILMDGRRSEMPAKIDSHPQGLVLRLDLDPGDVVHFGRYLDEARDPSLPPAEPLRARERAPLDTGSDNLEQMWLAVRERLDDDSIQQAFIQACLRHQQMDFAIRCYRRLKEERPGDERVARYLQQAGTIISFYALRKDTTAADQGPSMSLGLKIALGLFMTAALIIAVLALFVG